MKKTTSPRTLRQQLNHYLFLLIGVFSLFCVLEGILTLNISHIYMRVFERLSLTTEISEDLTVCDQNIQNYVLTHDLYYFRQYDNSIVNIQESLDTLQELAYSEEARQTVITLQNLYDNYVNTYIALYSNYTSMYQYYPQTSTYVEDYQTGLQISGYIQDTLNDFLDTLVQENAVRNARLMVLFHRIMLALTILLIAAIILSILLSLRMSDRLVRPLERLTQTASQIGSGDVDAVLSPETSFQEVYTLSCSLASMTQSLKQALEDSRKQAQLEALYKETRYRALLAQVRPHFLFNLLTAVSQSAMSEGSLETVEIVGNISKFLRYSLHNFKSAVTLKEELDIVRSYVFLQQKRLSFPLELEIQIDPSIDPITVQVPWMTLQPIVENSIVHGLEPTFTLGKITVAIKPLKDSYMEICIQDNGIGISENMLTKLNGADSSSPKENAHTSIGIQNIRERLSYCYQGRASLKICSSPGEGTTVLICLPQELSSEYAIETEVHEYAHSTDY